LARWALGLRNYSSPMTSMLSPMLVIGVPRHRNVPELPPSSVFRRILSLLPKQTVRNVFVLIQIDCLSISQLSRALTRRNIGLPDPSDIVKVCVVMRAQYTDSSPLA
jgi:hypothetical protein